MTETLAPASVLSELDDELRDACTKRADMWRRLVIKDSTANRAAYAEACNEVDELLELRHDLAANE